MKNRNQNSSLAEQMPYWEFFENPKAHVVLSDGSLVTGLKVALTDTECFDTDSINQFTLGLRSALNSVSEGITLQFYLHVDSEFSDVIDRHKAGESPAAHELVKTIAKNRYQVLETAQANGELYRPHLYLFVRSSMIESKKLSPFKKKQDFDENAHKSVSDSLEVIFQNADVVASSLSALGIESTPIDVTEMQKLIYVYLNPKRSQTEPLPKITVPQDVEQDQELLKENPWMANQSPREQLVFGDLILDYEQFILDRYYHKVITLKTLPEVTYAGQLANFLRMPFHYDLRLSVEIPSQASEMAKLQQKRKMAHSLAQNNSNRASDLESETKLSATEELIRELLNSGQRIYASQLTIVLKEVATPEGLKALNRQTREVLSRFRALQGAEGLEETVGSWKIFKNDLVAAPLHLERARKMKTNNLADFLPMYGPREGDFDPAVIFRNRLNGLVGYNPFDPNLPNYNALVTGSSGAGKSFLNNCILLQELNRDLRVFIIDIGGSYKKLTEALGGQYLDINLNDKYCINPFHLDDPHVEPSDQKVKSLLAVVESMVVENDNERLAKLDRVLLERAIIELYAKFRAKGLCPTLSDLAKHLSSFEEQSMRDISKMLYSWTGDRPYGKLLDGQGSLNASAMICAFDLKGLSSYPDLQSVMLLILNDFILTQVEKDKDHQKRILIDEAWSLLKTPSAAAFMEYCVRTLRKSRSGITFITQGVEEIVTSPIGPAILNNTATKFIMLQRGDSEVLKNTLKLNSEELSLIFSLQQKKGEFSEGFMIEGLAKQVIRVFPSPIEYWLSTSDAFDNKYLETLMQQGLSLQESIIHASAEYPNGVQAGKSEVVA